MSKDVCFTQFRAAAEKAKDDRPGENMKLNIRSLCSVSLCWMSRRRYWVSCFCPAFHLWPSLQLLEIEWNKHLLTFNVGKQSVHIESLPLLIFGIVTLSIMTYRKATVQSNGSQLNNTQHNYLKMQNSATTQLSLTKFSI